MNVLSCADRAPWRRAGRAELRYGARRALVNGAAAFLLALFAAWSPGALAESIRILALGDSLTAGYGLPPEDSFPAQLEAALKEAGIDATVINAGVSGDTTSGVLTRIDWALGDDPDVAIVAIGANDMLRATDPEWSRANLDKILAKLDEADVPTLVAGFLAPPNLGEEYRAAFDKMYPELAEAHGDLFYPFFLDGVAADPKLNQDDRIHPNAEGVAIIVERILPYVQRLVGQTS